MDIDVEDQESARRAEERSTDRSAPTDGSQTGAELPDTDRKLYANRLRDQPLTSDEIEARQRRLEREQRFGRDINLLDGLVPPPGITVDSYAQFRPSALYLQSEAVAKMDTKAIMNYANLYVMAATCLGVEWIDDASLVIVFSSPQAALSGLSVLAINEEAVREVRQAAEAASDIYSPPNAEALAILGQYHASRPLIGGSEIPSQSIGWLRLALQSDKKQKGARQQSQFYAERANHRVPSSRSQKAEDTMSELERLDAELDMYVEGATEPSEAPRRRMSRRRSSPRPQRDRDLEALDRELHNLYDDEYEQSGRQASRGPRRRRDFDNKRSLDQRLDQLDRELDLYADGHPVQTLDVVDTEDRHSGRMRSDFLTTTVPLSDPAPILTSMSSNGNALLARLSSRPTRASDRWEHDAHETDEEEIQPVEERTFNRAVPRVASIESREATQGMRGWQEANTREVLATSVPLSFQAQSKPSIIRPKAIDLFEVSSQSTETIPRRKGQMYGWDD